MCPSDRECINGRGRGLVVVFQPIRDFPTNDKPQREGCGEKEMLLLLLLIPVRQQLVQQHLASVGHQSLTTTWSVELTVLV